MQHGQILQTLYWAKETKWFYLYEVKEYAKPIYSNRNQKVIASYVCGQGQGYIGKGHD